MSLETIDGSIDCCWIEPPATAVVNRPSDVMLPGAKPAVHIGGGAQLYVRTPRFSYTAYLHTPCPTATGCPRGVLLIDEQLFDLGADEGEAVNLAYAAAHASTRGEMLRRVVADWQVVVVGSTSADRAARALTVGELARCTTRESTAPCPIEAYLRGPRGRGSRASG